LPHRSLGLGDDTIGLKSVRESQCKEIGEGFEKGGVEEKTLVRGPGQACGCEGSAGEVQGEANDASGDSEVGHAKPLLEVFAGDLGAPVVRRITEVLFGLGEVDCCVRASEGLAEEAEAARGKVGGWE
jgi:hypothetical protein